MTIIATPNSKEANYLISLEDADGTKIGFIPTDAGGKENISGVKRFPLVRTGLKTATGSTKYSDFEEPYMSIPQDDWTGGRGAEDLDDDATEVYDANSVNTSKDYGVILAGLPTYSTGYRSQAFALPGSVSWATIYGDNLYRSREFAASATYDAYRLEFLIKKVGDPGSLTFAIYSNTSGHPGSVLVSKGLSPSLITDTISYLYPVSFAPSYAPLVSATRYHVVAYGSAGDDADNHWEIAFDASASGDTSSDGTSWNPSVGIYYRVSDSNDHFESLFWEYKQQLYMHPRKDSGTAANVYMNGDRGLADSNSANLSRLNDATKSWTADEWVGCIAAIIRGPGSEEPVNWRTITDNGTNYLVVDTDWSIAHTTSSEYVIKKSDKWTSITGTSGIYTDVAVADEFVYMARGDDTAVLRMQEWNNGGSWSLRTASDVANAQQLLAIRNPALGHVLYGSRSNDSDYGVSVWKGQVPEAWGDLYTDLGTLATTNTPWDAWVVGNVTQSTQNSFTKVAIAAGFTTGVAAVENLDAPIDISQGTRLGVLVKSDVATTSGDLKLVYDDVLDLGRVYVATSVKKRTSVPAWSTLTNAFDGRADTKEDLDWTTTDEIYVFGSVKFSQFTVDMGATVNAVASVLSATMWNGSEWLALTITDGTDTAGVTMSKDGTGSFTPLQDWSQVTLDGVTGYAVLLKVSVNLTASIDINEIKVSRKNNQYLTLPGLTANQWAWATPTYSPTEQPQPDETAIQSIGLYVNTDLGAQNVWLRGGVHVLKEYVTYQKLPGDAKVNRLVAYASETGEKEVAWAITENLPYKLENDDGDFVAVPIPLKEMAGLRSEVTGKGAAVNDVYLYFNLDDNLERYFNRNLDDIGPNRGAGLPEGRQGTPIKLLSYPGRLIACIDAGATGFSSVLEFVDNSWHELFRAPYATRLRSAYVQAISGTTSDRLWINFGSNVVWIPISLNPYYDTDYRYMWEGSLTSAWMYGGMVDIIKMWNSLKLFSENVNAYINLEADYQTDNETTWNPISGVFDTMPVEELDFSTANPPTVKGRRLRYRVRFNTNDNTITPRLKAAVVEAIGGAPVKYGYTWTFELAAGG